MAFSESTLRLRAAFSQHAVQKRLQVLGQSCSFELSPDILQAKQSFNDFKNRVNPQDSIVFVNWVHPTIEEGGRVSQATRALLRAGYETIPVIPLCRFKNPSEMLSILKKHKTRSVMIVGGNDCALKKQGPPVDVRLRSALDFLQNGGANLLRDIGVTSVGVAAYPEGFPHLASVLESDTVLEVKLRYLLAENLDVHVVSQFTLHPVMLTRWLERFSCTMKSIESDWYTGGASMLSTGRLKVHVGVAGPTRRGQLERAAKLCKVPLCREGAAGTSQELLSRNSGDGQVWPFTDVKYVAAACERLNLPEDAVRLSLYPFGGLSRALDFSEALRTEWMRHGSPDDMTGTF